MIAVAHSIAAAPLFTNPTVQVYSYPTADSCATWTNARREKQAAPLEGWLLGLVTGANAFGRTGGDLAPGVTGAGFFGWVDQYCTAKPLDSVTQAGFALIQELQKRKSR